MTSTADKTLSIRRADRLADLFEPATVVLFAGLGGVCIGVEQAYVDGGFRDKYIDLAVNHWETAVEVHELNHPMTQHLHADVLEVDPNSVLPGRRIVYLHASPDCTDFSKAKGGKPKRKHIRALADVVVVWAGKRRPDVITLENVEEFLDWGPLDRHGQPDKKRRGEEFRRWKGELEALGYVVEHKELRACDYGTPTTRKRLFVVARCDGKAITWPKATHGRVSADACAKSLRHGLRSDDRMPEGDEVVRGDTVVGGSDPRTKENRTRHRRGARHQQQRYPLGRSDTPGCQSRDPSNGASREADHPENLRLAPYRTAAECIDFSLPMLSIFATRADARGWAASVNTGRAKTDRVGIPQRPLKPKTQKRIAGGLFKWVLQAKQPFIVPIENYGWNTQTAQPVSEPLTTVTAGPRGGKHAAVDVELAPFTSTLNHGGDEHRSADLRAPLATVTGANDARGLVGVELAPFTVPRHGERDGQDPRSRSIERPLPTVTATDNGAQLVAVALNKHFGGVIGQAVDAPIGTVTGVDHHSLLAAHVAPFVARCAHGDKSSTGNHRWGETSHRTDAPLPTVTASKDYAVVAAHLVKFRGVSSGNSLAEPLPTVTSGAGAARDAGAAHAMGMACCYLSHMYTSNTCGGQGDPRKPLKTITSGGQHAKVCVVYLQPFYGEGSGNTGHTPAQPLPTAPSKDRFAMLSVESTPHWVFAAKALRRARQVARWAMRMLGKKVRDHLLWVLDPKSGKTFPLLFLALKGAIHLVTDIAMRMLRPRELARAQGFDDSYVIDRTVDGRAVSKADQVKLIGNSVPPQLARAIARANVVDLGVLDDARSAGEAVPA